MLPTGNLLIKEKRELEQSTEGEAISRILGELSVFKG